MATGPKASEDSMHKRITFDRATDSLLVALIVVDEHHQYMKLLKGRGATCQR